MEEGRFLERAGELLEYATEYRRDIRSNGIKPPDNPPDALAVILGSDAPLQPITWTSLLNICKDKFKSHRLEAHPYMFGMYPYGASYESALADMLHSLLPNNFTSRDLGPSPYDLEVLMCDWFAKAIGLPDTFQYVAEKGGGGVLLGSSTEGCLMAMTAARHRKLERETDTGTDKYLTMATMVAYTSNQAHGGVEQMFRVAGVRYRQIETAADDSLDISKLESALTADRAKGLIPFMCVATVGTTGTAAVDDLRQIGNLCEDYGMWLHVDASQVGNLCICPEYRHYMDGIELAQSVVVSPAKGMLVGTHCSGLWLKEWRALHTPMNCESPYLDAPNSSHVQPKGMPAFHNMQIPTAKSTRALKLLFTFCLYGTLGIQTYLRQKRNLVERFRELIQNNSNFELVNEHRFFLTCFRLVGENRLTRDLVALIQKDGRIFVNGCVSSNKYYIRFIPNGPTNADDIEFAWKVIMECAATVK